MASVTALLLCISGCSGSGPASINNPPPGGVATPGTPANSIYAISDPIGVAAPANIVQFPKTGTGNLTPTLTITGPKDLLLTALAIDTSGSLYAAGEFYNGATPGMSEIVVYAPGASGTATPVRTLSGVPQGAGQIEGLAVDGTGNLYVQTALTVGTSLNSGIAVYSPGSNNVGAPNRFISGGATQVSNSRQLAVDATGTIYTSSSLSVGPESVLIFAPGTNGNVAPTRTIGGANTQIFYIQGLALDAAGNLYVATLADDHQGGLSGTPSILVFSASASGNVAPTRSIAGAATTMGEIWNISVDSVGNIYVLSQAPNSDNILKFGPTATGNVPPIATISSAAFPIANGGIVAP